MNKCPYCAEEIQDEAIACHYCGRDLSPGTVTSALTTPSVVIVQQVEPKMKSSSVAILLLLIAAALIHLMIKRLAY